MDRAKTDENFLLLRNPEFLESNFKDLLWEGPKHVKIAVTWNCNKIDFECHALGRNHGVADIEKNESSDEESYYDGFSPPYELLDIDGWSTVRIR